MAAEQFFSLNGHRAISGRLTIQMFGAWVADVVLANEVSISGDTAFVLGDLSLKGTTRANRSGVFAGKAAARVVGGYDGWSSTLPPKGYAHDAGVKLSTILQDAATEAKEKIEIGTDSVVGVVWSRKQGRASRPLRLLIDGKWWIDENGVTQTKPRPATPIASPFTLISYDPKLGQYEISTETYRDWTPGRTFRAPTMSADATISSVSFVAADGKIRLTVKDTTTKEDRLLRDIRAIVRDEVYRLEHGTIVEYVVTAASEDMIIDAKPSAGKDSPWPPLAKIKLKAGLFGETVKATVGAKCLVVFMDNDPALYRCIGIEGATQSTSFESSGDVHVTAGGIFKVCGGGNFVALANLVDQNFATLVTEFNAHIHPTAWGPSLTPTTPMPAYSPVACTKTKTD